LIEKKSKGERAIRHERGTRSKWFRFR
jgi:hypothetical protein